jgi:hypothetical protein
MGFRSRGARMAAQTSSRSILRHWHWFAVLAILLFAMIPGAGLWIAGISAFVGIVLVLIGGLAPFARILFTDPGTVGLMLVSRSARFEMMNQPDSHPYKQLVRGAFAPTRGMFWRGVLLVVAFIPAAFINANIGRLVSGQRGAVPPPAGPPPLVVDQLQLPNRGQAGQRPGPPPGQRPGPPPGFAGPGGPNRGVPQGMAKGPTLVVTITYAASSVEGSLAEQVQEALGGLAGVQGDTIAIDEQARQITFEVQQPPSMAFVLPALGRLGLQNLQMSVTTKPGQ